MSIATGNLPIFFLILVGIGIAIILIGIVRLAGLHGDESYYVSMNKEMDSNNVAELFSYFLQEEEKKNQDFREMVMDVSKEREVHKENNGLKDSHDLKDSHPLKGHVKEQSSSSSHGAKSTTIDKQSFNEIIERYQKGESPQEIAKSLKKGIGEVKLVISLYSMG